MKHLVIIGNGIAGVTVARNVRKASDMRITIISSESQHHYSRTALMYVFMGHMKFENTKPYEDWFWEKNRIDLVHDFVTMIDTNTRIVTLKLGASISYDALVLATGSKPNFYGWPGQDLPGVQGLYSLQDLGTLETNVLDAKHAIIVGGGLIGIELAEMLHSRQVKSTFLVRENSYWGNVLPKDDAALVSRHILEHGFDIKFSTELKEILPGRNGAVRSIVTTQGEEISCQLVGLTPGVSPNIDLVRGTQIGAGRGILVNEYLETNISDVYAAGDCVELPALTNGGRNRFEQLWYTGKMQGEALAKTICGVRTRYERGIWFNSAKFLDIEFQTYGTVPNIPREGEESFYWGDAGKKISLRAVYSAQTHAILGINVFGIRLRHQTCERWIREHRPIEFFIASFHEACFDPEFSRRYAGTIAAAYHASLSDAPVPGTRTASITMKA